MKDKKITLRELITTLIIPGETEIMPGINDHFVYAKNTCKHKIKLMFDLDDESENIVCSIQNIVLVPWYDCEVQSICPGDDYIVVFLKEDEYLINNFKHCLEDYDENKTSQPV